MCVLDNREVRQGWEPVKESVAAVMTKHGAEVLSSRRWDERRLGYPMRGQQRGTFLLTYFKTDTQSLVAIRRDLQFNDAVMRFLTMQCEEVPETAYEPEAEFDVNAIPVDDAPDVEEPVVEESAAEGSAAEESAAEGSAAGDAKAEGDGDGEGDGEAKAEGDADGAASESGDAPAADADAGAAKDGDSKDEDNKDA